jgi:hypothetical protein
VCVLWVVRMTRSRPSTSRRGVERLDDLAAPVTPTLLFALSLQRSLHLCVSVWNILWVLCAPLVLLTVAAGTIAHCIQVGRVCCPHCHVVCCAAPPPPASSPHLCACLVSRVWLSWPMLVASVVRTIPCPRVRVCVSPHGGIGWCGSSARRRSGRR